MDQKTKKSIEDEITDLLQINSEYKFSEIKPLLKLKTKEDNHEAKKIYKELTSVKLKYSNRKNGCTTIPEITKKLRTLIDENKLDFDKKNNLILLTKKNAEKIESLIANDPDYFPFAKTIFDKFGSQKVKNNTDMALFAVIREIDRDNSTNVWRYNKNRESFNKAIDYISNRKNKFFKQLKDGENKLPDTLCEKCGPGLKSLSSKICKYLCEFVNHSNGHNDNYYINDKYIRHALPFYLKYYKVDVKKLLGEEIKTSNQIDNFEYVKLFKLLEELNKKSALYHDQERLTRNELDHIIWYCYKSFNS